MGKIVRRTLFCICVSAWLVWLTTPTTYAQSMPDPEFAPDHEGTGPSAFIEWLANPGQAVLSAILGGVVGAVATGVVMYRVQRRLERDRQRGEVVAEFRGFCRHLPYLYFNQARLYVRWSFHDARSRARAKARAFDHAIEAQIASNYFSAHMDRAAASAETTQRLCACTQRIRNLLHLSPRMKELLHTVESITHLPVPGLPAGPLPRDPDTYFSPLDQQLRRLARERYRKPLAELLRLLRESIRIPRRSTREKGDQP